MKVTRRLLYAITWLTDFSAFLLIFVVSRDLAERGASLLMMGVAGGGLSLVSAFSCVLFGHLSDRIGRKRLIRAGVLVLLGSIGACGILATGTVVYFAAYWCCGIGLGLIYPPLIAWLSEGHDGRQIDSGISRTLIRFCLAWNLGLICGQLSGGWLFTFGRNWPIALALVLVSVDLVLVFMAGHGVVGAAEPEPQPTHHENRRRTLSGAFATLSWISNLGGAFATSMIFHLFPKLAVELGIASDRHGALLVLVRAVAIGTYLLMYHSTFWHHRFSTALTVQGAAVGGMLLISVASGEAGLMVGLIGLGLLVGYNYFASLYYSTTGSGQDRKGIASGIHEATLALGLAAGSFLGGFVGTVAGVRAPYVLAACVIGALGAVQTVVYFRYVRPLAKRA